MRKAILQTVKAAFPVIAGFISTFIFSDPLYGQQFVIADKDNTRPEQDRVYPMPVVTLSTFNVDRNGNYNEIRWTAMNESNARRYIIEYSLDGTDFQTAGDVLVSGKPYLFKHTLIDNRPVLYRIRTEHINGRSYYSTPFLLDGIDRSPVQVYPTIVTGNIVNVNAVWPVERINISSMDGVQVFAKDVNGQNNFIPVAIPSLSKGVYFITFYGNGWNTTSKFLIP